ncbi:MAG: hypothetical protein ACR2N7_04120 [Acidimicrobiia bacterium]
MNSDTLIRQLSEADDYAPEHDLPESAFTSTVALTEIRRRIDMDAKELTKPVAQPSKRRPGWLIAGVTFAGILIVVGLVAILNGGERTEPAATTPTTSPVPTTSAPPVSTTVDASAVTVAELAVIDAFVAAWNSGDQASLREVVDENASMAVLPWSNREGIQWMMDLMASHHTMESVLSVDSCRRSSDRVFCSMYMDGPVEDALTQTTMRYQGLFLLAEDRVLSVETDCVICPELIVFDDVRKWVGTIEPVDADAMERIPFEPHSIESAELWLLWAPLWVDAGRPALSANR